jgi:Fe2+ transport system protein FeoA
MSPTAFGPRTAPHLPARDEGGGVPLSKVAVGWRRVIDGIHGPDRAELEREGILPGSVVVVTARTPLGGPVIVEVGRARIALSAAVAAQVATRPLPAGGEPQA